MHTTTKKINSERKKEEKERNKGITKQSESNKMAISTYLSKVTLIIKGLNSLVKRQCG